MNLILILHNFHFHSIRDILTINVYTENRTHFHLNKRGVFFTVMLDFNNSFYAQFEIQLILVQHVYHTLIYFFFARNKLLKKKQSGANRNIFIGCKYNEYFLFFILHFIFDVKNRCRMYNYQIWRLLYVKHAFIKSKVIN